MIVAGATAYPRIIDPAPLREIADEVGALFMFDAAHIAGLIAGGVAPQPGALRRRRHLHHPQDAARAPRRLHPVAAPSTPRPSTRRSSPACRAARSSTSSRPRRWRSARPPTRRSRTTPPRSCANAQALAEALAGEGFRLVSGGTDNHLMLVDLRPFDAELTGKEAQDVLDRAGITLNKNTIPDDPRSPFVTSGVRIGTPAVTTQGMTEAEMADDRPAHRPGPAAPRRRRRAGRRARRGRHPLLEVHARTPLSAWPARAAPGTMAVIAAARRAHNGRMRVARRATLAAGAVRWSRPAWSSVPSPRGDLRDDAAVPAPGPAHRRGRRARRAPGARSGPRRRWAALAMVVGFLVGHARRRRSSHAVRRRSSTAPPSRSAWCWRRVLMLAVGTIDDLREVSPPAKIAGIVLCASVLVFAGVSLVVVPRAVRRRRRPRPQLVATCSA